MYPAKKILSVILILLLTLTACGTADAPEKSLYEQGLEVIVLMDEMIHSEGYVDIYTGSEVIQEIIHTLAKGDYAAPKAVYAISLPAGGLPTEIPKDASDALRNTIQHRMVSAVVTQINAMSGAETLAAASVCTAGKTFVSTELTEDLIYLYTYNNAHPIAVTFTSGEDSTVTASGMFLLHEDFPRDSAEEMEAFLSELSVSVTQLQAG